MEVLCKLQANGEQIRIFFLLVVMEIKRACREMRIRQARKHYFAIAGI
jgi:hypothetical protein